MHSSVVKSAVTENCFALPDAHIILCSYLGRSSVFIIDLCSLFMSSLLPLVHYVLTVLSVFFKVSLGVR